MPLYWSNKKYRMFIVIRNPKKITDRMQNTIWGADEHWKVELVLKILHENTPTRESIIGKVNVVLRMTSTIPYTLPANFIFPSFKSFTKATDLSNMRIAKKLITKMEHVTTKYDVLV